MSLAQILLLPTADGGGYGTGFGGAGDESSSGNANIPLQSTSDGVWLDQLPLQNEA